MTLFIFFMKLKKILLLFTYLLLLNMGCTEKKEDGYSIEGLSYLDQTPVRIKIANGMITSVDRIKKLPDPGNELYVGPGLFDIQVNGYKGISFVDVGKELTPEGISLVTKSFWKEGITTYVPTLSTNDKQIFLKNLALLKKVKEDPALYGSIAGFHLEGPYISPEDGYRGAHPLKYVRKPDWDEFMEFYEAAGGNILEVTVAPEVEGVIDFISRCRGKNIVVGLGHHNGKTEQITQAADKGAQICTHLGNGCANHINRHVNPLWPQLADDRLMISIIADGFHLLPEEVRVFHKVKGINKTIMTSDMSPFGGLPPGRYLNAIGDTIEVTHEGAVIYPAQKVLSGSASPLSRSIGNVMKFTGCTLGDAMQMASTNPARLFGFTDRGEIKPGLRADLILFTMEDLKMNVRKTIVNGEVVYDATR
jgi:N-acetylglucosamine-6-phosphate deacetylase